MYAALDEAHTYAIIREACVPLRKEPQESVEMISQLLFGEVVQVETQENDWWYVSHLYDGYTGWVDAKMLKWVSAEWLKSVAEWQFLLAGGMIWPEGRQALPSGALIPLNDAGHVIWESASLTSDSKTIAVQPFGRWRSIAQVFWGVPYLWGGCGGFGIDCSGFTQRVYRMCGKWLPRDSRPQAETGEVVSFGAHEVGDLVFFSKPNQTRISHVGLVWTPDQVIHASGSVRIDTLTADGILHIDRDVLTHQLETIRR